MQVNFLKLDEPPCSYVGLICKEIQELIFRVEVFSIKYMPRKGNGVGYRLAQFGLSLHSGSRWLELALDIISNVLFVNFS